MPIISIAFYMVIIRVGLAKRDIPGYQSQSSVTGRSVNGSAMISTPDQQYSMNRMQVHITKLTETNDPANYPYDNHKLDEEA